jgi:FKBP-type peptidyl-prolyl cis-trans isomerase
LIAGIFLSSCQSNDEAAVSPTVQPGGAQTGAAPSGVQMTYSGLKYEVLQPGNGRKPRSYERVKVHYTGRLPDGTVFDSSVQRGQPFVTGLSGGVIRGWLEGIPLMDEGAKYRFTIPPQLAYGAAGAPPKIGPNQTLIFDIELIEIL